MGDQYRALTLSSRLYGFLNAIGWAYVLLHLPPPGSEPAGVFAICFTCPLNLLRSMYAQYTRVLAAYRRVILAMYVVGACLHPAWTVLGRPYARLVLVAAYLVGDLIGFTLDYFRRASFARSQAAIRRMATANAQLESLPPDAGAGTAGAALPAVAARSSLRISTRVRAHYFALRFDDDEAERTYSREQFVASYPIALAALLVILVANSTSAILSHENENVLRPSLIRIAVLTIALAMRVWLHLMDDQYRALTLFSRLYGFLNAIGWAYILLHPPPPGSEPAGILTLFSVCALIILRSVYAQYTCVLVAYRRLVLAMLVVSTYLHPTWTVVGRPYEPLMLVAACLVGELIGLTIDHFLRSQASERMRAVDAHARAEQAEQKSVQLSEQLRRATMENMELELSHAKANRVADSRLNHLVSARHLAAHTLAPHDMTMPAVCVCTDQGQLW